MCTYGFYILNAKLTEWEYLTAICFVDPTLNPCSQYHHRGSIHKDQRATRSGYSIGRTGFVCSITLQLHSKYECAGDFIIGIG